MNVYVAMINDRHAEPEPYVFATAEAAIGYARSQAREFARSQAREFAHSPEDCEETPIDGWLFHATYSCEGDSVWVLEKELQDAPPQRPIIETGSGPGG